MDITVKVPNSCCILFIRVNTFLAPMTMNGPPNNFPWKSSLNFIVKFELVLTEPLPLSTRPRAVATSNKLPGAVHRRVFQQTTRGNVMSFEVKINFRIPSDFFMSLFGANIAFY